MKPGVGSHHILHEAQALRLHTLQLMVLEATLAGQSLYRNAADDMPIRQLAVFLPWHSFVQTLQRQHNHRIS